jgi:PIN domain nuclease of toxin-antitoxin system
VGSLQLRLVPLSPVLSYRSTVLPHPFPNDPADQIIVATARAENATILTKDEKILAYEKVSSLW